MNLKEILNASLTRTKSRLAELQGKVEKNEVRSEELAAVKAEVEQLTKEIQTISEELAKLEEKEKEEDPAKKKDDDPEKKKIQQQKKIRMKKRNCQKNNVQLFQHLSQQLFLLKVIVQTKKQKFVPYLLTTLLVILMKRKPVH